MGLSPEAQRFADEAATAIARTPEDERALVVSTIIDDFRDRYRTERPDSEQTLLDENTVSFARAIARRLWSMDCSKSTGDSN